MQRLMFNLGYVFSLLLGWRDETMFRDARVFRMLGITAAEYTAPDRRKHYSYSFTLSGEREEVYALSEVNANEGQRQWVYRATDMDLIQVQMVNQRRFEAWCKNPVASSWLDAEYRVVMRELQHRYRTKAKDPDNDVEVLAKAVGY